MKTLNLAAVSIALLTVLSACNHTTSSDEALDNKNVKLEDMRASEKTNTLASSDAVSVINLEQHEAVTSYTEMVKNKLQAVVSVEKPVDVRFCIIDNNGVMMQSFVEKSTVGDNKFNIDFSEMELGQYFVVMVYNDVYRRFCVAKTN